MRKCRLHDAKRIEMNPIIISTQMRRNWRNNKKQIDLLRKCRKWVLCRYKTCLKGTKKGIEPFERYNNGLYLLKDYVGMLNIVQNERNWSFERQCNSNYAWYTYETEKDCSNSRSKKNNLISYKIVRDL